MYPALSCARSQLTTHSSRRPGGDGAHHPRRGGGGRRVASPLQERAVGLGHAHRHPPQPRRVGQPNLHPAGDRVQDRREDHRAALESVIPCSTRCSWPSHKGRSGRCERQRTRLQSLQRILGAGTRADHYPGKCRTRSRLQGFKVQRDIRDDVLLGFWQVNTPLVQSRESLSGNLTR